MAAFERFVRVVAAAALALAFVCLGFFVCVAPPVTHWLANAHSDDVTSPFTRSQLVRVADATRDFTFGAHDELALYRAIAAVDAEYAQEVRAQGGTLPTGFPNLDVLGDNAQAADFRVVLSHCSDRFCYTPDIVAHLEDCRVVAGIAGPLLACALLIAAAALVFLVSRGGARAAATTLVAAGCAVLGLFVFLGLWALLDFNGLFRSFHLLFFSQGNWTFPADSLLICALPAEFWQGMGTIWFAVTLGASILSLIAGLMLARRAKK